MKGTQSSWNAGTVNRQTNFQFNLSNNETIQFLHFVRVDSRLPERAELAWVKLEGLGEVHYLAVRRSEDGVMDYEEQLSSALDTEQGTGDLVWRLTIERISREMAGFYQCEVRENLRNLLFYFREMTDYLTIP